MMALSNLPGRSPLGAPYRSPLGALGRKGGGLYLMIAFCNESQGFWNDGGGKIYDDAGVSAYNDNADGISNFAGQKNAYDVTYKPLLSAKGYEGGTCLIVARDHADQLHLKPASEDYPTDCFVSFYSAGQLPLASMQAAYNTAKAGIGGVPDHVYICVDTSSSMFWVPFEEPAAYGNNYVETNYDAFVTWLTDVEGVGTIHDDDTTYKTRRAVNRPYAFRYERWLHEVVTCMGNLNTILP